MEYRSYTQFTSLSVRATHNLLVSNFQLLIDFTVILCAIFSSRIAFLLQFYNCFF